MKNIRSILHILLRNANLLMQWSNRISPYYP